MSEPFSPEDAGHVVMMILQFRRHPADKKSGTDSVPPKA